MMTREGSFCRDRMYEIVESTLMRTRTTWMKIWKVTTVWRMRKVMWYQMRTEDEMNILSTL